MTTPKQGGSWRRQELSRFLSNKRRALPASTYRAEGQFDSGRRRGDGLRREELAALTGIGLSWYTRLEQGRDMRVSAAVASVLAGVLQLGQVETDYLFHLAGLMPPDRRLSEAVPIPFQPERLLKGLEPTPALVIDGLWNVHGCNVAARRLLRLTPNDDNLLVWLFTSTTPTRTYADFEDVAMNAVAHLRVEAAAYFDDAGLQRLISELRCDSPTFERLWHAHRVTTSIHARQRIGSSDGSVRTYDKQTWRLEGGSNLRLLVLVPIDED